MDKTFLPKIMDEKLTKCSYFTCYLPENLTKFPHFTRHLPGFYITFAIFSGKKFFSGIFFWGGQPPARAGPQASHQLNPAL